MPESLQLNKKQKTTYNDRVIRSLNNIQNTGRYSPWFSMEKSQKLWLSTETDFVDLHSISWDGYSPVTVLPSELKMNWKLPQPKNLPKTFSQSLRPSMPDTMGRKDTSEKGDTKVHESESENETNNRTETNIKTMDGNVETAVQSSTESSKKKEKK